MNNNEERVTILNKVWMLIRTFNTIIAYMFFSFGAVALGSVVYAILLLLIRNHKKRKLCLRWIVSKSFKLFIWFCGVLFVFRVHADKEISSRVSQNCIVIANHPTLIDYVILTSLLGSNNCCMVKYSLTQGFMGAIIKHLEYVNNQSDYDEILKIKEQGDSILIFPEGTRTKDITNIKFHRGAANMSLRLGLDIQPIYIYCDQKGYLNNKFLSLSVPIHTPNIYVKNGERIDVEQFLANDEKPLPIKVRNLNTILEHNYQDFLANVTK